MTASTASSRRPGCCSRAAGIALFLLGGLPWVVWGIAVRVSVSLTGHWLVGHYAHRGGEQGWRVEGVAVQGYNLKRFGLVTFGESFHGNHHAFPESAQLGLEKGELDLGWTFIRILEKLGLASSIKLPGNTVPREGLRRVARLRNDAAIVPVTDGADLAGGAGR